MTKNEKAKSYTNLVQDDSVAVTGSHPEKYHFLQERSWGRRQQEPRMLYKIGQ